MATKKINPGSQAHKLAILQQLYDAGVTDEKALAALDVNTILCLDGISIEDLRMMLEIQKQVRAGKLFSFLGEQPKERGGSIQ